jgi:hypothetical protein
LTASRRLIDMNQKPFNKALYLGTLLVLIGIVSIVLENIFYQTLDENNVLQESFFMPLGAFAIIVGGLSVLAGLLKAWLNKRWRRND